MVVGWLALQILARRVIPGLVQEHRTAQLLYYISGQAWGRLVLALVTVVILRLFIITILNLIIKSTGLLIEHLSLRASLMIILPLSVLLSVGCAQNLGCLVLLSWLLHILGSRHWL